MKDLGHPTDLKLFLKACGNNENPVKPEDYNKSMKVEHIIKLYVVRKGEITVPHGDIREIMKISRILSKRFPEEIIMSDVRKTDFAALQERYLTYWRLNRYNCIVLYCIYFLLH